MRKNFVPHFIVTLTISTLSGSIWAMDAAEEAAINSMNAEAIETSIRNTGLTPNDANQMANAEEDTDVPGE